MRSLRSAVGNSRHLMQLSRFGLSGLRGSGHGRKHGGLLHTDRVTLFIVVRQLIYFLPNDVSIDDWAG